MDIPDLDGNDDQLVVHYYYGNCHSVYQLWYLILMPARYWYSKRHEKFLLKVLITINCCNKKEGNIKKRVPNGKLAFSKNLECRSFLYKLAFGRIFFYPFIYLIYLWIFTLVYKETKMVLTNKLPLKEN